MRIEGWKLNDSTENRFATEMDIVEACVQYRTSAGYEEQYNNESCCLRGKKYSREPARRLHCDSDHDMFAKLKILDSYRRSD